MATLLQPKLGQNLLRPASHQPPLTYHPKAKPYGIHSPPFKPGPCHSHPVATPTSPQYTSIHRTHLVTLLGLRIHLLPARG